MFNPRLQHCVQLTGVYVGVLQRTHQQTFGAFQQTQQQVLNQNNARATCHAALGTCLKVTPGSGIQRLYQLLQVYVDHGHPSLMNVVAQGHDAV